MKVRHELLDYNRMAARGRSVFKKEKRFQKDGSQSELDKNDQ